MEDMEAPLYRLSQKENNKYKWNRKRSATYFKLDVVFPLSPAHVTTLAYCPIINESQFPIEILAREIC